MKGIENLLKNYKKFPQSWEIYGHPHAGALDDSK